MSSTRDSSDCVPSALEPERERLADLERRSLLAEQARQQAHRLRTPLSVITLIAETFQLELHDDRTRLERFQRLLGAASAVSNALTAAVCSTRFGDGSPQWVDPSTMAANIVRTFGGDVVLVDGEAAAVDNSATRFQLERNSFEAALIHCLRLIGIGSACNGNRARKPLLELSSSPAGLTLRLRAQGLEPPQIPDERGDYRLMALAAERVARDSGGSLVLTRNSATLRLPPTPKAD